MDAVTDLERTDASWAGTDDTQTFAASDGFELFVHSWPEDVRRDPRGIIIALHGMNDHGGRFAEPSAYWADKGLLTYAYDQRGFGRSRGDGRWPGADILARDLVDFTQLVTRSHPGVPITLLGESLGGGVALAALGQEEFPAAVNRAVLVAPAVEGREAKSNFENAGLWTASHTIPALPIPTEAGFKGLSDDTALIDDILADPDVRKTMRVDMLWGFADLMDEAVEAANDITLPTLVIYGGDDVLIGADSVLDMVTDLGAEEKEFCYFPNSGHLLLHEMPAVGSADKAQADELALPTKIWESIAQWQRYGSRRDVC